MKRWIVAVAMTLVSLPAFAGLISVSQEGVNVQVSWTSSGQVIDLTYVADFTGANANIIGTTMDAFSFQIGSNGNTVMISSFSATATSGAAGTWTGYFDKVTGNGCKDDGGDSICYTVNPTASGNDNGQIVAAAIYSWTFSVTLNDGVDVDDALSGDHSVKFLTVKEKIHKNTGAITWSTGLQLSQSGSAPAPPTPPPPPPVTIAEPAALVLMGLGLAGIGFAQRRRLKLKLA